MDKEKNSDFPNETPKEDYAESASRARNRTVMLTPEMTSQVRSRFQQEIDQPAGPSRSGGGGGGYESRGGSSHEAPGSSHDTGFHSPLRQGRNHAAEQAPAQHTLSHGAGQSSGEGVTWIKEAPVIGFLVSYDSNPNGEVYDLRSGRLIVSNQAAPGESILVLKDASVSSMHAIIRISATGEIQVLDQLSEFGTKIKRADSGEEISLSGDKTSIEHGDIVSFGSRNFFCLHRAARGAKLRERGVA